MYSCTCFRVHTSILCGTLRALLSSSPAFWETETMLSYVINISVSLMSPAILISRSRLDRTFNSRIRFESLRRFPLKSSHAHPRLPVVVSSWAQPFLFSLSADLFPSAQCDGIYYWGNTREKTCSNLVFSTKPTRFIWRIFTSRFSIKSHLPLN